MKVKQLTNFFSSCAEVNKLGKNVSAICAQQPRLPGLRSVSDDHGGSIVASASV